MPRSFKKRPLASTKRRALPVNAEAVVTGDQGLATITEGPLSDISLPDIRRPRRAPRLRGSGRGEGLTSRCRSRASRWPRPRLWGTGYLWEKGKGKKGKRGKKKDRNKATASSFISLRSSNRKIWLRGFNAAI